MPKYFKLPLTKLILESILRKTYWTVQFQVSTSIVQIYVK